MFFKRPPKYVNDFRIRIWENPIHYISIRLREKVWGILNPRYKFIPWIFWKIGFCDKPMVFLSDSELRDYYLMLQADIRLSCLDDDYI